MVESSTFGSEFVALRIMMELIVSLRYKFRMIGLTIEGAVDIFSDSESMYNIASFYKYQLKESHQAIYFYQVRKCMDTDIIIVHRVDNTDSHDDMLTGSLPGCKHIQLRNRIMYSDNPNIY